MSLLERYVFRRTASTLTLTFLALGVMVWLSQALRAFDLIAANGQDIWMFLSVTAFLIPVLVIIVFPIAALIAVIHTLAVLNSDSELVVVNASGARQHVLVRPILLIGLVTTILVGAMTLHFAPLSLRLGNVLITTLRSDILTTILRDGEFMTLAPDLTFHMRGRNRDGSLSGIFVSDERDPARSVTYLAESGAILDNPLGVFLIMTDGTIQQRNKLDQSISMIEFSSYAFDLSTFTSSADVPAFAPRERSTGYLLNPDPDDPYFRQFPGRFRAELHDRLTTPLYGLVFVLVPLLFLGQAASPRESRATSIALAVIAVLIVRGAGFFIGYSADTSPLAVMAMYGLPLATAAATAMLVLAGVQLRGPERLVAVGERLSAAVGGLLRSGGEATAGEGR